MQMHKILTVAKRDYIATVRTKAFLFGLVVAPVLFGGGSIGASFLKGKPDLKDVRIGLIDRTGVVADSLIQAAKEKDDKQAFDKKTRQQIAARHAFEVVQPAADADEQLLELSDRMRRKELAAVIEIGPQALHPPKQPDDSKDDSDAASRVSYYTNAGGIDEMRSWLNGPIENGVRWARLKQAGIDPGGVKDLSASVNIERLGLVERDPKTGKVGQAQKRDEAASFFVPFSVALILAMIVMVGSAPMLQNVTQDKNNRLMEMLLGSATPFELMAGKVLGGVGVSVTSSVLYVIGGVVAVNALGVAGLLPLSIIPWFYMYLLADVVMLCSLAAGLGAACSTPQDAQNLAIILLTPVIIPMFLLVTVLREPNSVMSVVLSLVPPFTPVLMLLRQSMPDGIPLWQPLAGFAGVVLFTLAAVWAASRVFRIAILIQGKPPRFGDLARWVARG